MFESFFIYVNHLNKLIHYNESDFQHYIYESPIYHIIPVYPFARYNKTLYICVDIVQIYMSIYYRVDSVICFDQLYQLLCEPSERINSLELICLSVRLSIKP